MIKNTKKRLSFESNQSRNGNLKEKNLSISIYNFFFGKICGIRLRGLNIKYES